MLVDLFQINANESESRIWPYILNKDVGNRNCWIRTVGHLVQYPVLRLAGGKVKEPPKMDTYGINLPTGEVSSSSPPTFPFLLSYPTSLWIFSLLICVQLKKIFLQARPQWYVSKFHRLTVQYVKKCLLPSVFSLLPFIEWALLLWLRVNKSTQLIFLYIIHCIYLYFVPHCSSSFVLL